VRYLSALTFSVFILLSSFAFAVTVDMSPNQIQLQIGDGDKIQPIVRMQVARENNWEAGPMLELQSRNYDLYLFFGNDLDGFKEFADALSLMGGAQKVIVPPKLLGVDTSTFRVRGEAVCGVLVEGGLTGRQQSICVKRPTGN